MEVTTERRMLYEYKKLNAYPMLCMNGCEFDSVRYNDSYLNFVMKDGFLKGAGHRTNSAMLSVEGGEDNICILVSEEISSEDGFPGYRTRRLNMDELVKLVKSNSVVIHEEYHSANRMLLRGEIIRPQKLLTFNHRRQLFELKFSSEKDLRMFYYFNDTI